MLEATRLLPRREGAPMKQPRRRGDFAGRVKVPTATGHPPRAGGPIPAYGESGNRGGRAGRAGADGSDRKGGRRLRDRPATRGEETPGALQPPGRPQTTSIAQAPGPLKTKDQRSVAATEFVGPSPKARRRWMRQGRLTGRGRGAGLRMRLSERGTGHWYDSGTVGARGRCGLGPPSLAPPPAVASGVGPGRHREVRRGSQVALSRVASRLRE